ncbi:MAG: preprotein translocase subunit SecG [Eubacteriales bacterium]|nr:preprotein translocase subunit SecG [Eubacteriales bacterium]
MQIAIGIILIISAIFLVVAVLMQHGKDHNLSGTIAGGAETFFGKSKASTLDKKLSKLTTIVAIVFTLLVLVSYLMQDTTNYNSYFNGSNLTSGETTGETDHVHEDGETHSDDETTADSETTAGEDTTADTEAAAETETEAAAE